MLPLVLLVFVRVPLEADGCHLRGASMERPRGAIRLYGIQRPAEGRCACIDYLLSRLQR